MGIEWGRWVTLEGYIVYGIQAAGDLPCSDEAAARGREDRYAAAMAEMNTISSATPTEENETIAEMAMSFPL